jgi:hypothetical protein
MLHWILPRLAAYVAVVVAAGLWQRERLSTHASAPSRAFVDSFLNAANCRGARYVPLESGGALPCSANSLFGGPI